MKALVGAFNQEKALVGTFSVIVKTSCETDGSFYSTNREAEVVDCSHLQTREGQDQCLLVYSYCFSGWKSIFSETHYSMAVFVESFDNMLTFSEYSLRKSYWYQSWGTLCIPDTEPRISFPWWPGLQSAAVVQHLRWHSQLVSTPPPLLELATNIQDDFTITLRLRHLNTVNRHEIGTLTQFIRDRWLMPMPFLCRYPYFHVYSQRWSWPHFVWAANIYLTFSVIVKSSQRFVSSSTGHCSNLSVAVWQCSSSVG